MPNRNILNLEHFASKTKIYLLIIAILLVILCIFEIKLIPIAIFTYTLVIIYTVWVSKERKSELSEILQDLTLEVNQTAKTTLINSPFPLAIIETSGNIIWKSKQFVSEFEDIKENNSLNDIINKVKSEIENTENQEKGSVNFQTIIKNKDYRIVGSYIKSKKAHKQESNYTTILYFINETHMKELERKVEDNNVCIGMIMIDNYEELNQRVLLEDKTILMANIEKNVYDWASKYNALILKSERDTFHCIIEYNQLKKVMEEKVSILDEIKKIEVSDLMQITLTIAFSVEGETYLEKTESAKATLEMALGRGGDQAIVKIDGKYEFFGGRTQEVEKRTKVKARAVAHSLKELIENSDNVLVMGHVNGDMDSIGSSMGIYRLAKTLGKPSKIINETTGISIDKFIESAKETEEYTDAFITRQEIENIVTENSLLVIVDTNKRTYVEVPELLEKIKRIVVIDHHRRGTDFIEDTLLTFHEVYASSAAELVTEILQYSTANIELTTIEMEALYAGIMLDTKDFTFKTGVRTFEAAAFLRKCGVDIIKVKKWFQNDLTTYQEISDIVSKSEIMNDTIAISIYDKEDENANIIAAKAADELLTIGGITASFVLGRIDQKIYISGRSIGDINVQVILEKLGGGGHITLAGAQLEDITIEDAKQELINRINEYFFEETN